MNNPANGSQNPLNGSSPIEAAPYLWGMFLFLVWDNITPGSGGGNLEDSYTALGVYVIFVAAVLLAMAVIIKWPDKKE